MHRTSRETMVGGPGVDVASLSRGWDTLDAVIKLVKTLQEEKGKINQAVFNTLMLLAVAGMFCTSVLLFGSVKKPIVVDQMTQTDEKITVDVHSQCDILALSTRSEPSRPAVSARSRPSGGPVSITPAPALARSYARAYPARPPSEAQVLYLHALSDRLRVDIPAEALTDATEASRVLTIWEGRSGVYRRHPA